MGEEFETPAFEQTWEKTIEHDHYAIKKILRRLETTTDLHHLVPILDELHTCLLEHFAREEAPAGLHELIASMAPDTVATLQNVLGEHQGFLERLDRLRTKAQKCLEGPIAAVLRDTGVLSESLHAHETRETRLFADAVFTDLGRSS